MIRKTLLKGTIVNIMGVDLTLVKDTLVDVADDDHDRVFWPHVPERYDVIHGRFDVPSYVYTSFAADSDEDAKARFAEIITRPALEWDNVWLSRVSDGKTLAMNKNAERM